MLVYILLEVRFIIFVPIPLRIGLYKTVSKVLKISGHVTVIVVVLWYRQYFVIQI